MKLILNIQLQESFKGCMKGTCGMLLSGNRAVRVPCYRRAIANSAPRYVDTALYGNRALRVPRYRRAVAVPAPRYMETES